MLDTRRNGLVALSLIAGLAGSVGAQADVRRPAEPSARYDGHKVVRVRPRSARDLQTTFALTDDVWTESIRRGGPIDIRVSPEQFAAVTQSGLVYTVLINDVQQRIDAESAEIRARQQADDPAWYTNYHDYATNKAYCQTLAATYPAICQYFVLGNSLQGREIFGLRITGPGSTANRPAAIWWGGQHAREWVTVPVTEYCAERLLTQYASDPHTQFVVNNAEIIFVPIMNPDGFEFTQPTVTPNNRLWRKNRRPNSNNTNTGCATSTGVDLNRNWGYEWVGSGSSTNCNSETYRGVSAFSEPETQVMRNFMQGNTRIKTSMDFHSYSQLILSPWGYTSALPTPASVAAEFQNLDNQMAAAIQPVHGMTYVAGPINTTIYPVNGGSVDWCFGQQGIKAFSIELRDTGTFGFQLPIDQITPTAEEIFPAFMVLTDFIVPCYANCDASTLAPILNVGDFACYLNKFAAGDSGANCDGSTVAPILNVADFACFLNKFAAGCP